MTKAFEVEIYMAGKSDHEAQLGNFLVRIHSGPAPYGSQNAPVVVISEVADVDNQEKRHDASVIYRPRPVDVAAEQANARDDSDGWVSEPEPRSENGPAVQRD